MHIMLSLSLSIPPQSFWIGWCDSKKTKPYKLCILCLGERPWRKKIRGHAHYLQTILLILPYIDWFSCINRLLFVTNFSKSFFFKVSTSSGIYTTIVGQKLCMHALLQAHELSLQVNFYAVYAHLYVNGNPDMLKLMWLSGLPMIYTYRWLLLCKLDL